MQERKEERLANGEEVYTNFENTKETDWSKAVSYTHLGSCSSSSS